MDEWLATLSSTDLALWGCALGGSLFFVTRVMLTLVGGFGADDMSSMSADGIDAHDSEVAFKFLSLNSIAAFIMMFGWGGLTASLQFELGIFASILSAALLGGIAMLGTAYFFQLVAKLQSPGEVFSSEQLVGGRGVVYERIPAEGVGRIQISVGGMTREVEAESQGVLEIESGESVQVSRLNGRRAVVTKSQ